MLQNMVEVINKNRLLSEYAEVTLRQNDKPVNYFSISLSMLQ